MNNSETPSLEEQLWFLARGIPTSEKNSIVDFVRANFIPRDEFLKKLQEGAKNMQKVSEKVEDLTLKNRAWGHRDGLREAIRLTNPT